MSSCKPLLLLEEDKLFIVQCKDCQRIGIHFNNLMLRFSPTDYSNFSKGLGRINFNKSAIHLNKNEPVIIIKTCHQDIQLTLTQKEFSKLNNAVQQATLLLSVHSLIKP